MASYSLKFAPERMHGEKPRAHRERVNNETLMGHWHIPPPNKPPPIHRNSITRRKSVFSPHFWRTPTLTLLQRPSPKKQAGLCTWGRVLVLALPCFSFWKVSCKCISAIWESPSLGQPKSLWMPLADRYHFIFSSICSGDGKSTFSWWLS